MCLNKVLQPALQHARRKIEFQGVSDRSDPNALGITRDQGCNGIEFFFRYLPWHILWICRKTDICDVKKGFYVA